MLKQILLSTPHMGSLEQEFVKEAFDTNWIAPVAPHVDAFEQEFGEVVGAKHAAAVSSGTTALHLVLQLIGVGWGDEVFCSTLTFIATVPTDHRYSYNDITQVAAKFAEFSQLQPSASY